MQLYKPPILRASVQPYLGCGISEYTHQKPSVKRVLFLILSASLILFLPCNVLSQGYPVQVNLNIGNPNSPLLENYHSGINPLINLRVLYKDYNSSRALPIRIYFTIESSSGFAINTNTSFVPKPIYINGGESYKIEDSELSQYFSKQAFNVSGTGGNTFMRNMRLPEGLYRVKVKIYEYYRNIPISNLAISVLWIRENDTPMLIQPENGSTVIARYPQNIMFTWVKRHINAPVGSSDITYNFQLFELANRSISPDIAVRSQRPIFTINTDITTLIYSSDYPLLIPGKSYVWRIQVIDNENYLLFKNNGFSKPQVFTFGQECRKPYNILVREAKVSNATAEWQNDDVDQESELRVREIGNDISDWYTYSSSEGSVLINQLSADRTYEIQLRNVCDNGIYSNWTYPLSFSTPVPDNSYRELKCTGQEISVDITDHTPLAELQVGDVITVNGFPATITSVEGSDGQFTGTCDMFIPLVGASIKHYFKNITVTNSMQVSRGQVLSVRGDDVEFRVGEDDTPVADTDDDKFALSGDTLSLTNGNGIDTVLIDSNGDVLIIDTKGDTIKTGKKEITIVDKTGGTGNGDSSTTDTYVVKDGKVIKRSGSGTGGSSGGSGSDESNENMVKLRFISPLEATGGFDKPRYNQMVTGGAYKTMQYQDKNYYIPWRSVETGKSAYIVAELVTNIDTLNSKHILFTDINGKELSAQITAGSNKKAQYIKVKLTGTSHEDINRITAKYYTTDNEGNKITKELAWIDVISYSNQPVDLVVAKSNGNSPVIPIPELQRELNRIYSQSIISFRVSEIDLRKVRFDKDGDGKVDAGETGLISNYTRETRAFKKAVRRHTAYDKGSFYIVMAPEASTGRTNRVGLKGRWALKTQVGFVFNPEHMSSKEFIHTVAHECGHGIFRLWHTFSSNSSYPLVRGTTNNLMDYTTSPDSTALFKYQWDYCHNPENMTGLFQDDEEGEMVGNMGGYVMWFINDIRCLRVNGKNRYKNLSFKYILGKDKRDSWTYPDLLDDFKYGSIWSWCECKNGELASSIDISIMRQENNKLYIGNNKECVLVFEVRDASHNESPELAKKLLNYLEVSYSVFGSQSDLYIKKLKGFEKGKMLREILDRSTCVLNRLNAEDRFYIFERIMEGDHDITIEEAYCIKKLFSTISDKSEALKLLRSVKSKGYDHELVKTINNFDSNIFSNVASGLAWLYYSQNREDILKAGKDVTSENFFAMEPLGDIREKYSKLMNDGSVKDFFDWMYNSTTNSYKVFLEEKGMFRIHCVSTEFSNFGDERYTYDFYVDPLETVSVYFGSRDKYVNIVDNTVVMPGVLLVWIIDQKEREMNNVLIELGITAATFYIGGMTVLKATGKIGKVFNTILFFKGFSDLVINHQNDQINKLLGNEFIESYKRISNIIDCTLIFKQFYDKEISQELLMLIKAWNEISDKRKLKLKNNYPEVFYYLDREMVKLQKK